MPAATTPVTVSRALPGSTARVIRRGDEVLGSCEWVTTAWAGVSGKGSRRGEWVITRADGSCVRGDHDTLADVRAAFA